MTEPQDPPRLLDDPGTGELRLGLERMSSNLPSPDVLARMGARLGVADGAPVNGRAPTSSTLAKIAAGVGVSGAVLFVLLRGGSPEPAVTPSISPPSVSPATSAVEGPGSGTRSTPSARKSNTGPSVSPTSEPESPPAVAEQQRTAEPAPPALPAPTSEARDTPRPNDSPAPRAKTPEPERATTPRTSRDAKATTTNDAPPSPAMPPVAAPPSETALLRDARLALNGDPARALALTEQHRREYPNGGFSQEREVIAITALARLGRTSEARSRAERFRSAHPTSPYLERIDRAVPP